MDPILDKLMVIPYYAIQEVLLTPAEKAETAERIFTTADIVYAKDVTTGSYCLIYGRERLEYMESFGSMVTRVAVIELDADTEEFNTICEMAKIAKGECDYRGWW